MMFEPVYPKASQGQSFSGFKDTAVPTSENTVAHSAAVAPGIPGCGNIWRRPEKRPDALNGPIIDIKPQTEMSACKSPI